MPFLRPYQRNALAALDTHLRTKPTNPCVVAPTGSGKSLMMAWALFRFRAEYPALRAIVLAHRKELVEQNYNEFCRVYPAAHDHIGMYCAAAGHRDTQADILFASIDSVYRRAHKFGSFDVVFVDEAHRIPFRGEGRYQTFLNACCRPGRDLRIVGWTATPYRMAGGALCHKGHLLHEVCYEIPVRDLIEQGYLCRLRTRISEELYSLKGIRKSRGDYSLAHLSNRIDTKSVVRDAVAQIAAVIRAEQRKTTLVFCLSLEHCTHVRNEFVANGLPAEVVTSETPAEQRDKIAHDFRSGKLPVVCNVMVYTEGFNVPSIDCIALLRPTLSKGLYCQMVGRGLRTSPRKQDCLVLDYAQCIDEHGPVDLLQGEPPVMVTCKQCREAFSRAIHTCPSCGWSVPKAAREAAEAQAREWRQHERVASRKAILSGEPMVCDVHQVFVARHKKEGSPDSLLVQYRCGADIYREWVCLDHKGYAERKALWWWRRVFGMKGGPKLPSRGSRVSVALSLSYLDETIRSATPTITVRREGKYDCIVAYGSST